MDEEEESDEKEGDQKDEKDEGQEDGEDDDGDDDDDDDNKDEDSDDESFVKQMETLDDDMDNISVPLVKISDESKALQFGLDKILPTVVYFKNQVPGLFDGDIKDTKEVLEWLTSRKTENNIQLVSDTILEDLVETFPYVACLFTGVCAENDKDCQDHLEVIFLSLMICASNIL